MDGGANSRDPRKPLAQTRHSALEAGLGEDASQLSPRREVAVLIITLCPVHTSISRFPMLRDTVMVHQAYLIDLSECGICKDRISKWVSPTDPSLVLWIPFVLWLT